MTLLATTKLEAVNEMLAAISEAPVATLATDTIDDALIAEQTLDRVSRSVQSRGWHFNTDYDYQLSVDGDSKLPYPATAAHVDPMDPNYDFVKRGNYLWDRKTQSFTFPNITSVKCKVIWLFDFEDLPQSWRNYVTMRAGRVFVAQQLGDEAAWQYSRQDEQVAYADAVADDLRRSDSNILRSSNSAHRIIHGRHGFYRSQ